jgi:hypothetical protein
MKMQARRPRAFHRLAADWLVLVLGGVLLAGMIAGCGGEKVTKPPQAPVVRVLTPDGGDSLLAEVQTQIAWTATDGDTPVMNLRITIEYTADGGRTWLPIVTGEQNDGSYAWVVPDSATSQAWVRVTATDGVNQGSDTSDGPFIIIAATPPPPNNTIIVGGGTGAPGATAEVRLLLRNQDPASLVEVYIWCDQTVAGFETARVTGRGVGMSISTLGLGVDTVKVTIQQQGDVVIAPGTEPEPVAILSYRLVGADGTSTELRLLRARFLDQSGASLPVLLQSGLLTVRTVGTPAMLTAEGWVAFEAGDFDLAMRRFDAAIRLSAHYGPAYTGRGWVQLSRATTVEAFRAAVSSFGAALEHGQTGADVRGGRAAARLALGGSDLAEAVRDAHAAVEASPTFVFPHRAGFDYRDLHLIAAFAEAGRGGRLAAARDDADRVEASGIRRWDPQTWTVDGVGHPTFEAAVLAWLHKLSAAFAG